MSRDDAVRAAFETLWHRWWPGGHTGEPYSREADDRAAALADAAAAVDAAAPHLTADLVRERDEALAEVERLRAWSLTLVSEVNAKASEARSWHAMWESAALRGDA